MKFNMKRINKGCRDLPLYTLPEVELVIEIRMNERTSTSGIITNGFSLLFPALFITNPDGFLINVFDLHCQYS